MPRGDSRVVCTNSKSNRATSQATGDFELTLDELIWLAGSICHLNGVPFDAQLVRAQVAQPCNVTNLGQILERLGFESVSGASEAHGTMRVAVLADSRQARPVPVLVVRSNAQRIDFFRVREESVSALTTEEFERLRSGPT